MIYPLLKVYRWFVSPVVHLIAGPGMGCRYVPTCSEYAEQAFRRHGWIQGAGLTLRRVCSCHPLGRRPLWDPVPAEPSKGCQGSCKTD